MPEKQAKTQAAIERIKAVKADLNEAMHPLGNCAMKLVELYRTPLPEIADDEEYGLIEKELTATFVDLVDAKALLSMVNCPLATITFNYQFGREMKDRHDESSYEIKKSIILKCNSFLRRFRVAIEVPECHEPSILLAVNSRDGFGRYTLESRLTRKRTGSYASIMDLLPVDLTEEPRRKEGLIERRQSKGQ